MPGTRQEKIRQRVIFPLPINHDSDVDPANKQQWPDIPGFYKCTKPNLLGDYVYISKDLAPSFFEAKQITKHLNATDLVGMKIDEIRTLKLLGYKNMLLAAWKDPFDSRVKILLVR